MTDTSGGRIAGAEIVVAENTGAIAKNVTSSSKGEFWKLLLPGQYRVTAYHNLCSTAGVILHSETIDITITEGRPLVVQDMLLDKAVPCDDKPK